MGNGMDNEIDKENYEIDLNALAEEEENKKQEEEEEFDEEENIPVLEGDKINEENNIKDNVNNLYQEEQEDPNSRPLFTETITQKVNDKICKIKEMPEANIEKWNYAADYKP